MNFHKRTWIPALVASTLFLTYIAFADSVSRGRYLVKISGCNDCHTKGYLEREGSVPEKDWLMGDSIGWRGPWGTTYATNLRLYLQDMPEDVWLNTAPTAKSRPPMPWFALHAMTVDDLRAIYQYVKSLRPEGKAAPAYVPPKQEPTTPYILMTPRSPKKK